MTRPIRNAASKVRRGASWVWNRTARSEIGEGVISAAIAVLIMAFLGVAMWFGFRATLGNTQHNVDNQVTKIGTDTGVNSGTSSGGATGGVGGTGGTGGTAAGG